MYVMHKTIDSIFELKLRINPRMHRDAGGCTTKKIKVGGTVEKRLLLSQQFKVQSVLY